MKHFFYYFLFSFSIGICQTPIPYAPLVGNYSGPYSAGTWVWYGNNAEAYQLYVDDNAQYTLKASESIHIGPLNQFYNFNSGYFHAQIDPSVLNIASFHSQGWNNIGRFDRFEIGVQLPNTIDQQIESFLTAPGNPGINPYSYSQITVEADFIHYGNGTTPLTSYHRDGFYYRDITINNNSNNFSQAKSQYPFRIRFAPPELGLYYVNITLKLAGTVVGNFNGIQMSVIKSSKRGFLSVGTNQHLKDYYGNSFFALGQNIPYAVVTANYLQPSNYVDQRNYIEDLHNNGGNFFRIRMDPWSNEIELEELGVYGSNRMPGEDFHRQWDAYELDKTFELAETKGMYMFFSLLQDQQFITLSSSSTLSNSIYYWNKNPYKIMAGAANPEDFFDINNPTFLEPYKNKVRYIMARYGYSSNIAMISLINETDNINNYKASGIVGVSVRQRVSSWVGTVGGIIKSYYPSHLLTNGYAVGPKAPDGGIESNVNFDIVSGNDYGNSRRVLKDRHNDKPFNTLSNNSNKPFIYGEIGSGLCDPTHADWYTDADFHNNLWATAMFKNAIGTGLYWWDWDQKYLNHRNNYKALNAFFNNTPPQFSDNFTSVWDCDASSFNLLKNRKIEWIANVSGNGKKGYGWVHNSDYFWATDPLALSGVSNFFDDSCYQESGYTGCHNLYQSWGCDPKGPYGYPEHNEEIVLKDYQASGFFNSVGYQVEIWTTYAAYGLDNTFGENATILGKIKFKRMLGTYPGSSKGDPDFAFKIHENNTSFRLTDSTYTNNKTDTEFVSITNPCVKAFGYLDYAKKGTDVWRIDNGVPIKEQNPTLCFPKEKIYNVTHSFIDTSGHKVTLSQNIQVLNNKPNSYSKVLVNENQVRVYPNPFTSNFIIESNQNIKSIRIYNSIGQLIKTIENINTDKFECSSLTGEIKGSFILNITFIDNTLGNFKLIKI